mmetsp:Transcript_20656/g.37079  ORF Transcript_20656/g.37079 Transcript_20656/m.37079 type:complete len:126 (+) Transcript_20656:198-575(+)
MTFIRFCHVASIAIGVVALITPSMMSCEAFAPSADTTRPITTELHLKRTVSQRFPFSKRSNQSENIEISPDVEEEEVYHRRIVHFELDSQKTHEKSRQTTTTRTTSNKSRRFGWDHHNFARSVDP